MQPGTTAHTATAAPCTQLVVAQHQHSIYLVQGCVSLCAPYAARPAAAAPSLQPCPASPAACDPQERLHQALAQTPIQELEASLQEASQAYVNATNTKRIFRDVVIEDDYNPLAPLDRSIRIPTKVGGQRSVPCSELVGLFRGVGASRLHVCLHVLVPPSGCRWLLTALCYALTYASPPRTWPTRCCMTWSRPTQRRTC